MFDDFPRFKVTIEAEGIRTGVGRSTVRPVNSNVAVPVKIGHIEGHARVISVGRDVDMYSNTMDVEMEVFFDGDMPDALDLAELCGMEVERYDRPPLDPTKRLGWLKRRLTDSDRAIKSYLNTGNPVPVSLVEEHNHTIKQIAEEEN